ncbi:oligopeptidase B [Acetobacter nitrogenifigens DSM 23921 = NBRC 105050]|uniref:Prolyl oligopeptidase n=1 Tax=Acetobacter nitrogenifigens DSM 23921 = NBRC 105050 TaxID=1120919 RepID=A0A511XAS4_9PROT|nr:S9 family peptidase [Acetobacter nitrogenifigens]GBQ90859.1 oligopeptidase B [Acetobacter nitrogenifigens DSM 23921 = NBRC 105050]GEN60068.1 prolyl oligopeptidase [Acetobacter nitrogenifigens DSM 23921 = NBRC 105050]
MLHPVAPPAARKDPRTIEQLGRTRTDDYAWMKDDNWQAVLRDPTLLRADIAEHLRAENAYSDSVLASTQALQAEIVAEMKGRLREDESYPALPHGVWRYGVRYEAGAQQPRHVRHYEDRVDQEEVLLDADARAKDHSYYVARSATHSPDHALFAWAEDTQGSEIYTVRVKDLASGALLPVEIGDCSGNFVFSPDSQYIFWTWRDENGRPVKVFRRAVAGGADELVYEEKDPGFFAGVASTRSGRWIVISSNDHDTAESWVVPGDDPTAAARCVAAREKGVTYDLAHWGDRFVVRTNLGDATDFRLMTVLDTQIGERAAWRELVPHRPGRYITDCTAFADHVVWVERVDANTAIQILPREGEAHHLATDEDAYTLSLDGSYEFATNELRYSYQSPTTPRQWLSYDLATRERWLLKAQDIPSGHDPVDYVCQRLFAKAPDGESVPITLLRRRDAPEGVPAPTLLYGYGSYGISIDPTFSTRNLSLVDRGWVYAIAHVRGGAEKGWNWFLGGRGETKTNTFTDFIACAEHLIAQGVTEAGRIVADGRSAGGMLMGAIANMRPELFAGIVAVVPFVDVLNTMSDDTLPLTPPEWPEWGNPLTDAAAYDRIAGYSPYDRIEAKPYPTVFAIGGLTDPRVTYWEPAKWIAKLREHSTSGRPQLLRINMEAGHGGASGRFKSLDEAALIHAFAIWAEGAARRG